MELYILSLLLLHYASCAHIFTSSRHHFDNVAQFRDSRDSKVSPDVTPVTPIPLNSESTTANSTSTTTTTANSTSTTTIATTTTTEAIVTTQESVNVTMTVEGTSMVAPGLEQQCFLRSPGGFNTPFNRIVGGKAVTKHELPWQIALHWKRRYRRNIHLCGGAVISKHWVITACHCTIDYRPNELLVIAGDHNVAASDGTEQKREVQRIFNHEKYNYRTQENDVSLMKLKQPLDLNHAVKPICLPAAGQKFVDTCMVSGWGKTKENGRNSKTLQKVKVPIVTDKVCKDAYRKKGELVTSSMICAGYKAGKFDACQGDSGGPFVCPGLDNEPLLAGVVSWGIGCARKNSYGVYTELSYFVDWVQQKVYEFSRLSTDTTVDSLPQILSEEELSVAPEVHINRQTDTSTNTEVQLENKPPSKSTNAMRDEGHVTNLEMEPTGIMSENTKNVASDPFSDDERKVEGFDSIWEPIEFELESDGLIEDDLLPTTTDMIIEESNFSVVTVDPFIEEPSVISVPIHGTEETGGSAVSESVGTSDNFIPIGFGGGTDHLHPVLDSYEYYDDSDEFYSDETIESMESLESSSVESNRNDKPAKPLFEKTKDILTKLIAIVKPKEDPKKSDSIRYAYNSQESVENYGNHGNAANVGTRFSTSFGNSWSTFGQTHTPHFQTQRFSPSRVSSYLNSPQPPRQRYHPYYQPIIYHPFAFSPVQPNYHYYDDSNEDQSYEDSSEEYWHFG